MRDDILMRYPAVAGKPLAMALLCTPLIELGRHADAYAMGRLALEAAPGETMIRDLVETALSANVPPFHLGMLRDAPRNSCYAKAIAHAVTPGMRVLDIGTGAGLLALLAARAGAEVVTCESNPMIAAAAREVVARNQMSDRIRVIAKRSGDLQIGRDFAEPFDLLVSEIFGDDLFEEGVLPSIDDAKARLLRPGAIILPPRAELRCALVADDRPREAPLETVLGFDLSPFAPLTRSVPTLPQRASPHIALRSPTVAALAVDFAGARPDALHDRITFTSAGGRIDGIAHWLRLEFGNGVVYENAPFVSPLAHWRVPVHAFAAPLTTLPGQPVAADARLFGKRLVISLAD